MKKQLVVVGLISVFVALVLGGCAQNDPLSGLKYINRTQGFGLNPPEGWTLNESKEQGVFFFGPATDTGMMVYLSPTFDKLSSGQTFSDYEEMFIQTMENLSANFSLISDQETTINGMNARELIYTVPNPNFGILKIKMIFVEKNNNIYGLSYVAPIDSYDTYLPIANESMNSFTIV